MDGQPQARAERWQDWMAILVAGVALVTALAGWRAATASRIAGFEDYFALTAALNRTQAETLGTGSAIRHLMAFMEFAVNDELQAQLEHRTETSLAEQAALDAQFEQVSRLAATNRNFFPGRYANKDGTYATAREIAESLADAERRQNLDPQPHLERSARHDSKTFAFVQSTILLGIALFWFTLAGLLHYGRTTLRWSAAVVGLVCLVIGLGVIFLTEFMPG